MADNESLTYSKIRTGVHYGSNFDQLNKPIDPWEHAACEAKIELGLACYNAGQTNLDPTAYEAVRYVKSALQFADGKYAAHGDKPEGPYVTDEMKNAFGKYADSISLALGTQIQRADGQSWTGASSDRTGRGPKS